MSVQTLKRYYLKKPTGKRKSLSLYLQTVKPDGTTSNTTINDTDIVAINLKLQGGVYSMEDALAHAEKVRLRYTASLGVIPAHKIAYSSLSNRQNLKIINSYWESEYSFRHIVDETSAYNKLRRAAECLQDLSIATATRQQITLKIKSLPYINSKKRQLTSSLNQLLKYAGRDFKIVPPKKVRVTVKHLTPSEFERSQPPIFKNNP